MSKVTQKYQITIPAGVRKSLGVVPGGEVDIVQKGNEFVLRPVVTAAELMPQFQGNRKELTRFLGDHRATIMGLDLGKLLLP